MTARAFSPLVLFVVLLLTGCGDGDDDPVTTVSAGSTPVATTAATASEAPKPKPSPSGIRIEIAETQFGEILFDADQRAIYLFDLEDSDTSRCYGACAAAWPPVPAGGAPVAGNGVDQALLGTTRRNDGGVQVTYAGHPLYYYEGDPAGQALCHNVYEFGGLWLVVQSDGNPAPA